MPSWIMFRQLSHQQLLYLEVPRVAIATVDLAIARLLASRHHSLALWRWGPAPPATAWLRRQLRRARVQPSSTSNAQYRLSASAPCRRLRKQHALDVRYPDQRNLGALASLAALPAALALPCGWGGPLGGPGVIQAGVARQAQHGCRHADGNARASFIMWNMHFRPSPIANQVATGPLPWRPAPRSAAHGVPALAKNSQRVGGAAPAQFVVPRPASAVVALAGQMAIGVHQLLAR